VVRSSAVVSVASFCCFQHFCGGAYCSKKVVLGGWTVFFFSLVQGNSMFRGHVWSLLYLECCCGVAHWDYSFTFLLGSLFVLDVVSYFTRITRVSVSDMYHV